MHAVTQGRLALSLASCMYQGTSPHKAIRACHISMVQVYQWTTIAELLELSIMERCAMHISR
jgi:hypothetical protein